MRLPQPSHKPALSAARALATIAIAWASCLPLLIPFGARRNIDLQGLVLLLAGASAWGALLLDKSRLPKLGKTASMLLIIFASFCLLAPFVTPHLNYNLLGAPYIRLGSLGLLGCLGIGLLVANTEKRRLAYYLYWYMVIIAAASAIYALRFGFISQRIGGVFNQADILACTVGCGLVLGWQLCSWKSWPDRGFIALQVLLAGLLLLTQTRAVIGLTLLLSIWVLYRLKRLKLSMIIGSLVILTICAVFAAHFAPHSRLHDANDAKISTTYRLDLNRAALSASALRPIAGYGPGNLADALDCKTLRAQPLLKTCRQSFFFNSSHNIYIDRALGLGWLAGLAFLVLVVMSLIRGRQVTDLQAVRILIALYYLTNVTSIGLELLFWIVILQALAHDKSKNS